MYLRNRLRVDFLIASFKKKDLGKKFIKFFGKIELVGNHLIEKAIYIMFTSKVQNLTSSLQ